MIPNDSVAHQAAFTAVFRTGAFRGGPFRRGPFRRGPFRTGAFRGGPFRGGPFRRGPFRTGAFRTGACRGTEAELLQVGVVIDHEKRSTTQPCQVVLRRRATWKSLAVRPPAE